MPWRIGVPPLGDLDISGRRDVYALRAAGSVIEVKHYRMAHIEASARCRKNRIQEWSPKSRKNCVRILAACPLPESWDMITLTYPREFPSDGRQVHRDLEAFLDRVQRRFGGLPLIWKLEFQRRGAPHLMLFIQRPVGMWIGERQSWLERAWAEALDVSGYVRATWIEWQGDPIRYMLKYLRKPDKEYQHVVPASYRNVGRWWGIRNMRPAWEILRLTPEEFFAVRRLLCRWRRANARLQGRKLRFRPGADGDGLWVLALRDGQNVVRQLLTGIIGATKVNPSVVNVVHRRLGDGFGRVVAADRNQPRPVRRNFLHTCRFRGPIVTPAPRRDPEAGGSSE